MPNIKLRDGSGVEQVYEGVDTISVPLADGSGTYTYGLTDDELFIRATNTGVVGPIVTAVSLPMLKKDIDRIKLESSTTDEKKYLFLETLVNLPVPGTTNSDDLIDLSRLIIDAANIDCITGICLDGTYSSFKHFPTIINNDDLGLNGRVLGNTTYTDEEEVMKLLSHFTYFTNKFSKSSASVSLSGIVSGYPCGIFSFDSINKKIQEMLDDSRTKSLFPTTSSAICNNQSNSHNIRSNKGIPIAAHSQPLTSTKTWTFTGMGACDHLSFATYEGGSPFSMRWKSQTIDLSQNSYPVGYTENTSGESDMKRAYPINLLPYEIKTIEDATTRYNELKSEDNYYVTTSTSVSYDGKTRNLGLLFSRYNHDSAVETINSLPDTSEYLATAGGTNTIKFKNYSGALTDAGGTNDLTEEEIAIATAKGWTVTLV